MILKKLCIHFDDAFSNAKRLIESALIVLVF